ncbi:biosynthetic peptidoglycan transglycosylase [Bacillus testis]|uniref:biosynthetic peptidoglycan transglycosylase n=1 Tax=Bacillus testis TaxID=1622072 RepID=UPI000AD42A6B|nr:biosynthetic peptidoglycan transglycosylase [Bacillus testis]
MMKKLLSKLLTFILIAAIIFTCGITALGYFKYKTVISEVPLFEKVAIVKDNPHYTQLKEINPDFTDSIVATEDHRFYKHGAIDGISLVRATIVNLLKGEIKQGGSTITQQVAKNLYFSNDQHFIRKVAEMFAAYDLEKNYTKDEILELYVNIVYYGDNNYGIQQASKNYFGTTPDKLSFDQATLLAGLPQAPSSYALSQHPERAKERQKEVIEALEKYRK